MSDENREAGTTTTETLTACTRWWCRASENEACRTIGGKPCRPHTGRTVVTLAWSGLCPAGKHGLDYEGQDCDVCRHEAGGPCDRLCRVCWRKRGGMYP